MVGYRLQVILAHQYIVILEQILSFFQLSCVVRLMHLATLHALTREDWSTQAIRKFPVFVHN